MSIHEENIRKFFASAGFPRPSDLGIQYVGIPLNQDNKTIKQMIEDTKVLMEQAIKPAPVYVSTDRKAPEGQIWQCQACGKRSTDLYEGPGSWDESCSLNAALVPL